MARPLRERLLGEVLLQGASTAVESRHDGSDGHVEDLCGISVRKVPDVDQHDDVAELRLDLRQGVHDRVLRQALDDLVRLERFLAGGRGHLVREVVVGLFELLRLRRALDLATPVDVQVREDAEEPRAQVRPRCERPPTPKCPCVRLLHQILCLLTRADESSRNPVHLVGEGERLLLEACAVAGLRGDPPCFGLGARLTHRRTVPLYVPETGTRRRPVLFPLGRDLRKARAREHAHDLAPRGLVLVPRERDLAQQVGVRGLDSLVGPERDRKPPDAALAADAAYRDRRRSHHGDASDTVWRRCTSRSASSMSRGSWVAQTTVVPVLCASSARREPISTVVTASSRELGSSAMTTGVRAANARARATRSRWPAESRSTGRSACAARPTAARASAVRACASSPSTPRSASPSSTFSRADKKPERPGACPTIATRSRRSAARDVRSSEDTATSPRRTSPSSGTSIPASRPSKVDFPEPDGPTTTVSSPGRKVTSSRSSAVCVP